MRWFLLLTVVTMTAVTLLNPPWFAWLDTHEWVPDVVLTAALLIATIFYTTSSWELVKVSRSQLQLERTPNLVPGEVVLRQSGERTSEIEVELTLANLTRTAARLSRFVCIDTQGAVIINAPTNLVLGAGEGKSFTSLRTPLPSMDKELANPEGQAVGITSTQMNFADFSREVTQVELYYQIGGTGTQHHCVAVPKLFDSSNYAHAVVESYHLNRRNEIPFDTSRIEASENQSPPQLDPLGVRILR